jgi:hypothetical protein
MSELRDDLKGSRGSIDGFSNQVDECRRSVAQESRTLADVHDSSGFEPHESCTGCIGSNRSYLSDLNDLLVEGSEFEL